MLRRPRTPSQKITVFIYGSFFASKDLTIESILATTSKEFSAALCVHCGAAVKTCDLCSLHLPKAFYQARH
jgi:hypothetical protein